MPNLSPEQKRRKNDPRDPSVLLKSERTRKAILVAAQEFFWSHPFRDLTVAELMSRAGGSRAVFYHYFADLHDLMENLLDSLKDEVLSVADPWFTAEGDPAGPLAETLSGLVSICYERGPIVRAVFEAAPMDERLEQAWNDLVQVFDNAVASRIEKDQEAGRTPSLDARRVAVALNRMDVGTMIHHFGRRPRSKPGPVCESITTVWISTLYGQDAMERTEKS